MFNSLFSKTGLRDFVREIEKGIEENKAGEINSSENPCMKKVDPKLEIVKIKNSVLLSDVIQLQIELVQRLEQIANLQTLIEELAKAKERFGRLVYEKNNQLSSLYDKIEILETKLEKQKGLSQIIGNLRNNVARLGKENGQLKKELAELKNPQQERKGEGTKEEEKKE